MTEIAMIINCLRLDQGFRVEIAELIGHSHVFHSVASTPIMAVRSALNQYEASQGFVATEPEPGQQSQARQDKLRQNQMLPSVSAKQD